MNSYVCITGAAGGLGKAFAVECAARGWDLYLTDLSEDKLETLKKGLTRLYDVNVLYDPCNLIDPDERARFWEHVSNIGIRFHMMINVAGLDYEGAFIDRNEDELKTIIRLNIEATVTMTRRLLDFKSLNRQLQIINVSSLAGFYPMPLKAVYAASKRFLLDFTRATRQELRGSQVNLLALCPAGLATKPETIRSITSQGLLGEFTTLQIGDVAAKTINRALIGFSVYIPGWINQLLKTTSRLLPEDWIAWVICQRWSKTRQIAAQFEPQEYRRLEKTLAVSTTIHE
jgi:short-subunit dehydrogenase